MIPLKGKETGIRFASLLLTCHEMQYRILCEVDILQMNFLSHKDG
jgi:hypothetical protein